MRTSAPTVTTSQIWTRYIISLFATGLLMAGFLYLVEDEGTRYPLGVIVLGITTQIWHWVYLHKLPSRARKDRGMIGLEIAMFSLGLLLLWQMGRIIDFTQDQLVKIMTNPLIWFYIWGLLAVGYLIFGLKSTQQLQSTKGIKPSDG